MPLIRRCALLLIGGDKTGRHRWYEEQVPMAEKLYDVHLETLQKPGTCRVLFYPVINRLA
jgi:hypothetical protein